jgi:lysyl-tRNA synthetase class 2
LELPVLTPAASGAAARTFQTHHNAFDTDFFLRICNETELKKATIGRFENVFIFGTDFRNEGSDPSHVQEFTMLEHQSVYKSFQEDMTFVEKMFDHIFDTLKLNRVFEVRDKD